MLIWLYHPKDENVIRARGRIDSPGMSAPFSTEIPVGKSLLGLSYVELNNLQWLETNDAGELIAQGKRGD